MPNLTKLKRDEKGFTLVELAIVMIIIGLLITGILKGQEMIANAQIASTVSQIKAVESAIVSFQDKYNGYPGDIANVGDRLPASCVNACDNDGDGNNIINGDPGASTQSAFGAGGIEGPAVFPQLSAADLLGGVNPGAAEDGLENVLEAEITGLSFFVGHTIDSAGGVPAGVFAANPRPGHYLVIRNPSFDQAVGGAVGEDGLSANEAQRIDSKMDDGLPESGSALAGGNAACTAVVGGEEIYNEADPDENCAIFIRMQ